MNDTTPAAVAPESPPEPGEEPATGSPRVWAVLLVLDCAFVIVFGGLVASKLYQYWNEPVPASQRHRLARPAQAAKPPAAETPLTPPIATTPIAATPAPAPPPAATPPPTEERPRPAPAAAAPAAASDGKPAKARPVDFKLRARRAASVQVVGAFIVRGGRKDMTRRADGVWSARLYLKPGRYRYFFFVDGKRELDPANPDSDRGASLLSLP